MLSRVPSIAAPCNHHSIAERAITTASCSAYVLVLACSAGCRLHVPAGLEAPRAVANVCVCVGCVWVCVYGQEYDQGYDRGMTGV